VNDDTTKESHDDDSEIPKEVLDRMNGKEPIKEKEAIDDNQ
jgi:hypothetical protein